MNDIEPNTANYQAGWRSGRESMQPEIDKLKERDTEMLEKYYPEIKQLIGE